MATMSEVKQQRKEFDGRDTYDRFADYCKAHAEELSPENLLIWDQKHNRRRLIDSFGTNQDNLAFAYLEKCRRFLITYCLRIPNGAPVVLPSGQKYQPRVIERRMVDGRAVMLRDVTNNQMKVIREQFRMALRQLLRTQKFFNMPASEIREMVEEELDRALDEKAGRVAAD